MIISKASTFFGLSIILSFTRLNLVDAIRCYKCANAPPITYSKEVFRLCQKFDHSEQYIVDCPYSTFCMKKDFTVNLLRPINGTVRDCAPQKNEYQVYEEDRWQMKVSVEEPYVEGCTRTDDKGQRIAQPQYCYCNSDLCNMSVIQTTSILTVLPTFLSILLRPYLV